MLSSLSLLANPHNAVSPESDVVREDRILQALMLTAGAFCSSEDSQAEN